MSVCHVKATLAAVSPRRHWLVVLAMSGVIIGLLIRLPLLIMYLAAVFFFLGVYVAEKGSEITQRSVSFCLPGYRESLRWHHLIEGGLVALGLALWSLSDVWIRLDIRGDSSDLPASAILETVSLFIAALAVYEGIGLLGYSRYRWVRGTASFAGVTCVWIAAFADLPGTVWPALLPVSLAIGVFSWIRLGDIRHVQQGHRALLHDGRHEQVETPKRDRAIERRVDTWFCRRMERHAYLSAGRYYWDELYSLLGPLLCHWRTVLVWLTLAALAASFLGEEIAGVGLVVFGLAAAHMRLPLAPEQILLLPVGRGERSVATGMVVAGISIVHSVFGTAVIALSWLLGLVITVLPVAHLDSADFLKINPAWFYWSCLLVPWATAPRLLRGWARRIAQSSLVIVFLLLVAGVYLLHYAVIPAWRLHALYATVLLAGWVLLLTVLLRSYATCDIAPSNSQAPMD